MIGRAAAWALVAMVSGVSFASADDRGECSKSPNHRLGLEACDRVIEGDGYSSRDRAIALYYRGRRHQAIGRGADAIEDFDASLELVPNNAIVLNSRGLANHGIGDYSSAIHDYDQAIAADAKNAFAYNNRGNAHYELESYEAAVRDYDEALRLDPKYANAHNGRANALCALNKGMQSHQSRLRAIELGALRVIAVQQRLERLGFLISEPTGILDPDTQDALREWALAGCPDR